MVQAVEVPVRSLPAILLLSALVPALSAQQPADRPQDGGTSEVTMRDGGVTEVLQSIYIPPILNAPFTAIVHTRWIRPLPEGGTFTLVNQRRVARDSRGRIYEERWFLVPKDGDQKSRMNVIQVADPSQHTLYNCFTLVTPHRCMMLGFFDSPTAIYKPDTAPAGPLPNGKGSSTHEDLGAQTIAGVETTGTRDVTIMNAGAYGNDRPYTISREFWFAKNIGINLQSELTGPRIGKQIFTLTDVSLAEPDPALFELPDGYEVVDRRKSTPPAE